MSRQKLLAVVTSLMAFAFFSPPGAQSQDSDRGGADYHNQRGIEYFKRGFYDHAPKNQEAEAGRNYGYAVEEFRSVIALDPSNTEAHRHLARVSYVQKKFDAAAEEYQKVTELAPDDLDAHVNLALALIELKRPDEAIKALENAKRQTADPKALHSLDTYIARVRVHQGRGVE